jgi:molecular chaperone GrpE
MDMSDTDTKNNVEPTAAELSAVEAALDPTVDVEWVLKTDMDNAQKELALAKDRLLRLQADFDNFRRRTAKERDELFSRANESLMTELLPVMDHVELALGSVKADPSGTVDPVVKGFKMVADQLQTTLVKFGLNPLDATGQIFDANLHESLSQIPSDDVAEGSVVTQFRRGYKLGEKLLRPARVVVSTGPAKKEEGAI